MLFSSCSLIIRVHPFDGTGILQFSVGPGAYSETIGLFFGCRTSGAAIVYTTDGTNPTKEHGTVLPDW